VFATTRARGFGTNKRHPTNNRISTTRMCGRAWQSRRPVTGRPFSSSRRKALSYEGAPAICGTAVGTIKSTANCARLRLVELLQEAQTNDIGPDSVTKAAIQE
jgi:hypothetical protein